MLSGLKELIDESELARIEDPEEISIFLSGYWDNAEADLKIIVKIAKEIVNLIENHDNSQWDTWAITLAIEAVTIGYFNNKNSFKVSEKSNLERILTIFKAYISAISPQSSAYQLLSNFE
jgi:hypothetical protein